MCKCHIISSVATDARGLLCVPGHGGLVHREKAAWGQHKDEVKGQDVFRGLAIQLCGERQGWCPADTSEFWLELKVGASSQGFDIFLFPQ